MKKLLILLCVFFLACDGGDSDENTDTSEYFCKEVEVSGVLRKLYVGPRDGCYYYNSNGNKSYVDRTLCQC